MAEDFEKFKRFDYHLNSNLVIQREGGVINQNEPTGEPESLSGRIKHLMGDKVIRSTPWESTQKKRQVEDRVPNLNRPSAKKFKLNVTRGATVLNSDVTENCIYQPATKESRFLYEQILNDIGSFLGDQPADVLRDAADEMIVTCHSSDIRDSQKKLQCEAILGKLTTEQFTKMYQLIRSLHDFQSEVGDATEELSGDRLDDVTGVAVVFDEEDEPEEGHGDEYGVIREEFNGEEEEEEGRFKWTEEKERKYLETHFKDEDEEGNGKDDNDDPYELNVRTIDAHWLQRELAKLYKDAETVVSIEKDILSALKIPELQECENRLVYILKYDNFNFAKLVLRNRWKVYYCTLLGQSQSEMEREQIMKEMSESSEAQEVLHKLEAVKLRINKEREFTRNVRKEAATLAQKSSTVQDAGDQGTEVELVGNDKQRRRQVMDGSGTNDEDVTMEGNEKGLKPSVNYLDLEAMVFEGGGRFMGNPVVKLHDNSQRIEKKAYDEVIVPPIRKPEEDKEFQRMSIEKLPEWTREAFTCIGVEKLNPVQTKVYPIAFEQHEKNMLVCAPTGSGKTNIAMLSILAVMDRYRDSSTGKVDTKAFKVVYISPMKALVAEQVAAFSKRLESFGIEVRELTGDANLTKQQIEDTQIIVTTPEKWDIVTRKAGDRVYTQLVKLIIIDEIHLLHDNRGPVLEAIVARTLRQIESTQEHIRLVGLSATLPNYQDVAIFLRVSIQNDNGLYVFGSHHRPVPLLQTYIGLKEKKAMKRMTTMNRVTYEKVLENAGVNQVLIFVHSRREAVRTARMIRQMAMDDDTLARFLQEDSASREILQTEAESIQTQELKDLIPYGFGVHHAGLPRTDRSLVEDLFADRHIQVLVSTATLAWGVNLPAHTVIIKGTQVYIPERGGWKELSPLDVMQMMGRAGRPQYDTSGHGIIITNHSELQFYLSLNNQQLPIESQLISMLPDILNAEIVLGSIRSRQDAVQWLGYTYLYVRLLRNPTLYGFPADILQHDSDLEQVRTDIANSALMLLDRNHLIRYDRRLGTIQVTALGRVASYYYIRYPSVQTYNEHLRPSFTDIELLRVFTLSQEFKYIPVREEEKVELGKLIERVPIPVKAGGSAGTIEDTSSKINVLLQAYISGLKLDGFALACDMTYIHQSAGRIMRALFEITLKRGWAGLAMRSLAFCKMISKRQWSTMSPLRQFTGTLPEDVLRKLEKKDFPWQRYYDLSSQELGELVRNPKLGKLLHRLVHSVPKVEMSAYVQPLTRSTLLVEVSMTPDFRWDSKYHDPAGEMFWIIVEDGDGETILHHELTVLKSHQVSQEGFELTLDFAVPITEPLPPNYFLKCVSDKWLQSETVLPISFKNLILPEKNPPQSELLDLQPLPVLALRYPQAEALYETKTFGPIETQTFAALYSSDDNVLICAPPNPNGLRTCAEFALLRMLKTESVQRCVCIVPYERCAHRRFLEWKQRFGTHLNLKVCELTGDVTVDLRLITDSNVIVTTPERWDFVSRRWKTRKVLQQIRLLIIDELELLDSDSGAALEVCVSRMRYISAQLEHPIRIIGLSITLANAADLAEWLGVTPTGLFNFHSNVRLAPLEVSLQAFDIHHRPSRLLATSKPVYQCIKKNCDDSKQAIVFCPDRKQTRVTAVDLSLHAAADDQPKMFLHVSDEIVSSQVGSIPEKSLRQTLRSGVGYLHEGLTPDVRQIVERLYDTGAIQVLIVSEPLTWDLSQTAHCVIVQETTKYDAKQKRWVDFPMVDVLRMISRAGCNGSKTERSAVAILCPSSKKEYYKKFIFEPLPVESRLDQHLADHINAEVTLKTIDSKQEAVDWLTWTLYYRRLTKNPNFYGLQGVSHSHLSEHLSEIVETSVEVLESAQCLAVDPEDGMTLTELNLGLVAAFYYIRYTTIELMNRSVTANTKRKGLIEIVCAASEFVDVVPIRFGEEEVLKRLAVELSVRLGKDADVNDPHVKALLLLYAHFNRSSLTTDLSYDQVAVLEQASRLLHALVDVISSNGWLNPALLTMELNQLVIQAMQPAQSPLLQLPHFDDERITKTKESGISDVFDLINAEDSQRDVVLSGLSEKQIQEVAISCNRYPVVNIDFHINDSIKKEEDSMKDEGELSGGPIFTLPAGKPATLIVNLERVADTEDLGAVVAPYFPKQKEEQWWLVVGQPSTNSLLAIKRVTVNKLQSSVKLDFDVSEKPGVHHLVMNLMCDSYIGCDQEYAFIVHGQ